MKQGVPMASDRAIRMFAVVPDTWSDWVKKNNA
jgi:hypothetical protein